MLIDDEKDLVVEMTLCLEAARQEKPNLILLDIVMPMLNGYEVCLELKKDPSTKKIPIIMVSARYREIDKSRGFDAGADDYITKPYSMALLVEKIAALTA